MAQEIIFDAPGSAVLVERTLDRPGHGQLRLESEVSLISSGTERTLLLKAPAYPVRPGYSLVGRVTEVGPGTGGYAVGDRVIAHVGHASEAVCDHRFVVKLPDSVRSEDAAFFAVGGMAVHATRLARFRLGDPVLIMGQGLIGLVTTQVARIMGAAPIVVVDVVESRLELARRFGADHAFLATDEEALLRTLKTCPGGGAAAAIELTGVPAAVDVALSATRRQGRLVPGSLVPAGHRVDVFGRAWLEGITIVGAYYNARPWCLDATEATSPLDWPIRLYDAGPLDGGEADTARGDAIIFLRLLELGRLELAPILDEVVSASHAAALFNRLPQSAGLGHLIRWKG